MFRRVITVLVPLLDAAVCVMVASTYFATRRIRRVLIRRGSARHVPGERRSRTRIGCNRPGAPTRSRHRTGVPGDIIPVLHRGLILPRVP